MKPILKSTGALLFLLVTQMCFSQDIATSYWVRYHNQTYFSKQWYFNTEVENRRFLNPDVQTQLILHAHLHYKHKRWDVGSGMTLSWAYAGTPQKVVKHPTTEIRPTVEVAYEMPVKKWQFQQRLRLDNRFIETNKFESVFDDANYILRIRYRAQLKAPVFRNGDGVTKVSVRAADEIMLNHKQTTFDQNRVYASIEYLVNRRLSIEGGYIHIYQQRFGKDEFVTRHVFRFTLVHRIQLY